MNWFEALFKFVLKVYFLFVDYQRGTPVLLDEKGVCLTPLHRYTFVEAYYHYDGRQTYIYEHRLTHHWTVYTLNAEGRVLRVKHIRRDRKKDAEIQRIEDEGYYELDRINDYVRIYVTVHPKHGMLYRITGKNLPYVLFEGNEDVTLQVAESVDMHDEPFELATYWSPFAFYRAKSTPHIVQIRWSGTSDHLYTGPCYNGVTL